MGSSQAILFLIFAINGLVIGILFDLFRITRRSFKTGIILTSIEDIFFWLLTGIIILYSIFTFNNGIIRGYLFLGLGCGIVLYLLTLSSCFIKINVCIINFIKRIVIITCNILLIPIKFIYSLLLKAILMIFRPISNIFINIKHHFSTFFTKLLKKSKKNEQKEGF